MIPLRWILFGGEERSVRYPSGRTRRRDSFLLIILYGSFRGYEFVIYFGWVSSVLKEALMYIHIPFSSRRSSLKFILLTATECTSWKK